MTGNIFPYSGLSFLAVSSADISLDQNPIAQPSITFKRNLI